MSGRRKRRRTMGTTWMDNVPNLPDLAALFHDVHTRPGCDLDGDADAAALMEAEETPALELPETGEAADILGVLNGHASSNNQTGDQGTRSKIKGSEHRETVVVEEGIDLFDYDEGHFTELGDSEHFASESDPNVVLVRNDNIIIPSIYQESCEGMECFPSLSSDDPEMGSRLDSQKVLRIFLSSRKLFEPWYNLLGFVIVCGSVRYTVKQYNLLRDILSWVSPSIKFPSYSTVQRTLFPHALKYLFPKSDLKYFVVRRKKKAFNRTSLVENLGGNEETASQYSNGSKTPVRIVPPSEWAKLDIMMAPFFN